MATISSSFAKKGNVAAYPRERQSLRRSKFRGESTPNLKRSPSVSSCLDLAPEDLPKPVLIDGLIDRYLDQIETLKKPNTFRKYNAVLKRFAKHFAGQTLDAVSVEDLNDFIVTLKKGGMSPNVIIIAQFRKRNGRSGITRQVHLPERISSLPREYTQEELAKFLATCDDTEVALFSTFLLTGFREQEVMYLGWPDVNLRLRTIRVSAKPDLDFFPKRWEERKVPVPVRWPIFSNGTPRRMEASSCFLHRQEIASRICCVSAKRSPSEPVSIRWRSI